MPQRLCYFLVVFLLIFNGEIFGQKNGGDILSFQRVPKNSNLSPQPGLNYPLPGQLKFKNFSHNSLIEADRPGTGSFSLGSNLSINPSYYANCLGFFCKKELQLEKVTTIPLRFRLGSLDYVNYLEQKPNAVKPGF